MKSAPLAFSVASPKNLMLLVRVSGRSIRLMPMLLLGTNVPPLKTIDPEPKAPALPISMLCPTLMVDPPLNELATFRKTVPPPRPGLKACAWTALPMAPNWTLLAPARTGVLNQSVPPPPPIR